MPTEREEPIRIPKQSLLRDQVVARLFQSRAAATTGLVAVHPSRLKISARMTRSPRSCTSSRNARTRCSLDIPSSSLQSRHSALHVVVDHLRQASELGLDGSPSCERVPPAFGPRSFAAARYGGSARPAPAAAACGRCGRYGASIRPGFPGRSKWNRSAQRAWEFRPSPAASVVSRNAERIGGRVGVESVVDHRRTVLGAALFHRLLSRSFIRVYVRGHSLFSAF